MQLNCSIRHINRMIRGYQQEGKSYFIHGNRGRKPAHTFDDKTRQLILDLYRTKYYDANFTHYSELLRKYENITVSPSSILYILMQKFIHLPDKTQYEKRWKSSLRLLKERKITEGIYWNPRAIVAVKMRTPGDQGALMQMKCSKWMHPSILVSVMRKVNCIAVDDATGAIMGAYFWFAGNPKAIITFCSKCLVRYFAYMLFTMGAQFWKKEKHFICGRRYIYTIRICL